MFPTFQVRAVPHHIRLLLLCSTTEISKIAMSYISPIRENQRAFGTSTFWMLILGKYFMPIYHRISAQPT